MSTSVTNEQSFEWQIEKALVGSTREERGANADVAAQSPEADRFFRATWVGPQAERPRFPGPLLRRTRGPDPSSKATLWVCTPPACRTG